LSYELSQAPHRSKRKYCAVSSIYRRQAFITREANTHQLTKKRSSQKKAVLAVLKNEQEFTMSDKIKPGCYCDGRLAFIGISTALNYSGGRQVLCTRSEGVAAETFQQG